MRDDTTPPATTASAHDPYDADRPLMLRCGCGADHAPSAHGATTLPDTETMGRQFMEASLIKAIFPQEPVRRAFLKAVGRRSAMAAIAAALPAGALTSLQAMAQ